MNASLLVALVLLAACSPALVDADASRSDRTVVIGEWDVVSATSARGSITTTFPPRRLAYRFAPDGTMGMYYDGALTRTATYEVERQPDGLPCVRIGESRRCLTIQGDAFEVDARPSDGPLTVYRRR